MPTPAGSPPHLNWLHPTPSLRAPVLVTAFAGWNDAGDAATIAARHIAEHWDAEALAEIEAEVFYDFSVARPFVQLDDDHRRTLTWPANMFRAAKVPGAAHDVVVLIGLEPQLRWRTFCEQVVGAAQVLGVSRVITLGALLADVPHSRPVEVYGATDDDRLMSELELSPSSYEGPTGIVGVLAAACRDAGIPTASFWAAVPSYVPGAPSPKAALSLVRRVCEVVGTSIYVTDLEIASAAYERQVDELVAEDEDTIGYVADLERAWDASDHESLDDDPDTLVAEVEKFLRDKE